MIPIYLLIFIFVLLLCQMCYQNQRISGGGDDSDDLLFMGEIARDTYADLVINNNPNITAIN